MIMSNINLYVANASKTLDDFMPIIKKAFDRAVKYAVDNFKCSVVDIIVVDAPYSAIPELGVGGYTPSANIVYINLDSGHKILEEDIFTGMVHELHHAMRWRNPGYGSTLKEALITEGLACLVEFEATGEEPVYTQVKFHKGIKIPSEQELSSEDYDHHTMFIAGNDDLPRWFGYAFGYKIVKDYSKKLHKTASSLVHEPASSFFSKLS